MNLSIGSALVVLLLIFSPVVLYAGGTSDNCSNMGVAEIKQHAKEYLIKSEKKDIESYSLVDISFSYTKEAWLLMYEARDLAVGDHFFLKIHNIDNKVEYLPGL